MTALCLYPVLNSKHKTIDFVYAFPVHHLIISVIATHRDHMLQKLTLKVHASSRKEVVAWQSFYSKIHLSNTYSCHCSSSLC